LKPLRSRFL